MGTRRSGLTSFQRLALTTTAITYFLIVVGGLVRASGAGLGCPDWPRCFGSWIPPLSAASLPPEFDSADFNPTLMWTEYLNRLLGVSVGFLILATCVSAWRSHRRERHILWPVIAALLLTGYEGWLGGRVVAHELAPWIVTVHLVVALVIVSLLLYATVYSFFVTDDAPVRTHTGRRTIVIGSVLVILLTLAQVAIGTQVRGTIDTALMRSVDRADALGLVGALDRWHREVAVAVMAGTIALAVIARSRHSDQPMLIVTAFVAVGLCAAQIGVGLILAYASLPPPAQVAHLGVASFLLGAQTLLFLFARWLPPKAQ